MSELISDLLNDPVHFLVIVRRLAVRDLPAPANQTGTPAQLPVSSLILSRPPCLWSLCCLLTWFWTFCMDEFCLHPHGTVCPRVY